MYDAQRLYWQRRPNRGAAYLAHFGMDDPPFGSLVKKVSHHIATGFNQTKRAHELRVPPGLSH